jgi:hypothetical protein
MSTPLLGRLAPAQVGKPVIYDAPERTVQAILSNQDSMIAALKAIAAKLDSESVGDGTLHTITDALQPIQLFE